MRTCSRIAHVYLLGCGDSERVQYFATDTAGRLCELSSSALGDRCEVPDHAKRVTTAHAARRHADLAHDPWASRHDTGGWHAPIRPVDEALGRADEARRPVPKKPRRSRRKPPMPRRRRTSSRTSTRPRASAQAQADKLRASRTEESKGNIQRWWTGRLSARWDERAAQVREHMDSKKTEHDVRAAQRSGRQRRGGRDVRDRLRIRGSGRAPSTPCSTRRSRGSSPMRLLSGRRDRLSPEVDRGGEVASARHSHERKRHAGRLRAGPRNDRARRLARNGLLARRRRTAAAVMVAAVVLLARARLRESPRHRRVGGPQADSSAMSLTRCAGTGPRRGRLPAGARARPGSDRRHL